MDAKNGGYILKNIRAQYKIPDSVQDLPSMAEWLKRMGASKYMIRRLEEAKRAVDEEKPA